MKPCRYCVVLIFILIGMANANPSGQAASAATPATSSQPPISRQTRLDLIRTFESELVYIRTVFPMGKKGLTLKDGVLSPSGAELQGMIATWGPSVKPGDQARISAIDIKGDHIHFEIMPKTNGASFRVTLQEGALKALGLGAKLQYLKQQDDSQ